MVSGCDKNMLFDPIECITLGSVRNAEKWFSDAAWFFIPAGYLISISIYSKHLVPEWVWKCLECYAEQESKCSVNLSRLSQRNWERAGKRMSCNQAFPVK